MGQWGELITETNHYRTARGEIVVEQTFTYHYLTAPFPGSPGRGADCKALIGVRVSGDIGADDAAAVEQWIIGGCKGEEIPPVLHDAVNLEPKGEMMTKDGLVGFLYILIRDHFPAGIMERIVVDHVEKVGGKAVIFEDPHISAYAKELAERIAPTPRAIHIVGKIESDDKPKEWQLVGVFTNEADGLGACRTTEHFIASVPPCTDFGDDPASFPGARYPKRERG